MREKERVLNLYAGLGGNRKLWPESVEVTAVEFNPDIAAVYSSLYPNDTPSSEQIKFIVNNFYLSDIDAPIFTHSKEFKEHFDYIMAKLKSRVSQVV